MQRLLAIISLTWKAAFRFRLFWVLSALLVGAVLLLPLLLKHDGTARGLTQILLTYTLGASTVLLGFATLWLACGTLARDIEECQMQMVAVKPVPRWQIWLGKWLGILTLDAVLLGLAGVCIYGLLQWRAQRLPAAEQQVLRNEVMVARGSLREPRSDLTPEIERVYAERSKDPALSAADRKDLRRQVEERVKASEQVVHPDHRREWVIDATRARAAAPNQVLFLRIKFFTAESGSGTQRGIWRLGSPTSARNFESEMSMAAETFHEFPIPPEAIDAQGRLVINFINRNPVALLFPLEEGLEVLYREGGFAVNYTRGLLIILCWLGLLAALGLAASSFLSFPVAAFTSMAVLVLFFGSGTLSSAVEEGTVFGLDHETQKSSSPTADALLLPTFKAALKIINLVQAFSPVDSLSTGRSIPWSQVAIAGVQIICLMGGLLAVIGITAFNRRELAAEQSSA